ncbi:hypothetical protein ACLOJK_012362 [Asimina triloba]
MMYRGSEDIDDFESVFLIITNLIPPAADQTGPLTKIISAMSYLLKPTAELKKAKEVKRRQFC